MEDSSIDQVSEESTCIDVEVALAGTTDAADETDEFTSAPEILDAADETDELTYAPEILDAANETDEFTSAPEILDAANETDDFTSAPENLDAANETDEFTSAPENLDAANETDEFTSAPENLDAANETDEFTSAPDVLPPVKADEDSDEDSSSDSEEEETEGTKDIPDTGEIEGTKDIPDTAPDTQEPETEITPEDGVGSEVDPDEQNNEEDIPDTQQNEDEEIVDIHESTSPLDLVENDLEVQTEDRNKRFVLFFLTPTKQVVSLRNLVNGVTISQLKSKLETLSGLPADMYHFSSSKYSYRDNTPLVLGRNVTMGAVIRLHLLPEWKLIYKAVERQDIDSICKEGGVALFGTGIQGKTEEEITEEFQKRLFNALYLSAYKNERKLCEVLIELGADVNRQTDFGNTVLHVTACQNHMPLVDFFLKQGSELLIHNRDGKTPIHIAQDIGANSCERYMRLYNWTLTGKRHFPDVESMKVMERRQHEHRYRNEGDGRGSVVNDDRRMDRCKSAPARKTLNSARDGSRSVSKFHSDCSRTVDFVAIHNVPSEMQYNSSVEYVQEPMNSVVETPQISETIPRRVVPYIDLAKSEENRTIIDPRKLRAKSAIVRAQHTPVYYNWYKDRERSVFPRRVRCKSYKSAPDLDELRRQKNEQAFRAWVRRKEFEGSFDPQFDDDDEDRKRKYYSEEENERAFKDWLDSKKELLERMGKRETREPFKTKRERIQAVVDIGDTEPIQKKTDPSAYHTAYHRWMRQRQEDQLSDRGQYLSVEDLKGLIETKRKRTVLNAKAYEEWLEEKREENVLRRRIKPKKRDTSPRSETFQKWIGMTTTGESSHRPTSSKSPSQSRMSVRSTDIATLPPSRTLGLRANAQPVQKAGDEKPRDIFEGFLYEDAWRNIQKAKPTPEEDRALRAVRFKPMAR